MSHEARLMKKSVSVLALLAMVAIVFSAVAARLGAQAPSLRAVGPIDPNTGFPTWYQDATGFRLEPCIDTSGNCLTTLPDQAEPAAVPDNYPDEAFYWS